MVTASDRLAVTVVVKRAVSSSAMRSVDSGASHVSVVAGTVITGTRSKSSVAGGRGSWDSGDLRVTELAVAVLALPELAARATSVVVGRARTKALLLLVVTAKEELHRDREKEEECSDNSDRETSSVEPAGSAKRGRVGDLVTLTVAAKALLRVGRAVAKRSVNEARALRCAIAGKNSNGDHSTAAKGVEDQAKQSKEGLAAKAAGEDHSGNGVEDRGAGETFYGLLPTWNRNIAISLDREEVGVDSKDDSSAAEL